MSEEYVFLFFRPSQGAVLFGCVWHIDAGIALSQAFEIGNQLLPASTMTFPGKRAAG